MSKKSTDFHIKSNDYFGTLATILTLINEKPEYFDGKPRELNNGCFKRIIKDLLYLQKNFKIIKK